MLVVIIILMLITNTINLYRIVLKYSAVYNDEIMTTLMNEYEHTLIWYE